MATKKRIAWNKGKKFPEWSGKNHHFYGKHHSAETKEKISNSRKGKISWWLGRHHSENTKKKISIKGRKNKYINCTLCGKKFYVSPSVENNGRKYCSRKCYFLTRCGSGNHNWNNGSSRYYKTGYYSSEYKNWRRSIFIRDEFTCQKCNKKHTYITAHHIKSFAKYPRLRFNINNGVTLCEECHKKTDNYGGRNKKK